MQSSVVGKALFTNILLNSEMISHCCGVLYGKLYSNLWITRKEKGKVVSSVRVKRQQMQAINASAQAFLSFSLDRPFASDGDGKVQLLGCFYGF